MEANGGQSRLELTTIKSDDQDGEDFFNDNKLPGPEAKLLEIVKNGEVDELEDHLMRHPTVDVNVRDYRGVTPLSIAVRSENQEMVEVLLRCQSIRLEDSMLHAVKSGNIQTMEILLNWCEAAEASGTVVDTYFESSEFEPHMTPLMLACHQNDYEMVRILLRHGHKLEFLNEGKDASSTGDKVFGETLELGKRRMDMYKAHASPVYMVITSQDPLYLAFLYAHVADKLAYEDPIFKEDYAELSASCRMFSVKVLEECRTTDEVRVLLAQPHSAKEAGVSSSGDYPRLTLAIEYDMKEFVTHKNCQQVVQNLWTQEHANIMWMTTVWRILYFIPHIIMLPFVYVLYFFVPCAPFIKYWQAPMNKFLGDMVSFFTFLALIFYTIVNTEISKGELGKRTPSINNGVDVVIMIYILSYLWDHVKLFYFYGLKAYTKNWWNIYTLIMTLMFLTSFVARLASVIIVSTKNLPSYRDEPRYLWPWNDPMLVSEGFYAFGAILAFGRILYLFTISQILGPLQLSLSNMITDVLQMMCIMMITMFAFATGISRLYIYYGGMTRIENGTETTQSDLFATWTNTFRTLFWDIFGYGSRDDPDLVVGNTCPNGTGQCFPPNDHVLTETIGFIMYGIFHLVTITTMLNMLIAMMGNTLSKIQENADVEWKFARSRLWIDYFKRSSPLPNPLNLIPTPYDIYNIIMWLLSCSSSEAGWDRHECCYRIDPDDKKSHEAQYKALMLGLMKRYLAQMEDDEEQEQVTPELLEQTKTDIIKEISRMWNQNPTRSVVR